MTYLISAVDGGSERLIAVVGTSGLFYTSALKTLKREFENTLLPAHLRLKSMLDKSLREFHQQIKLNFKVKMVIIIRLGGPPYSDYGN